MNARMTPEQRRKYPEAAAAEDRNARTPYDLPTGDELTRWVRQNEHYGRARQYQDLALAELAGGDPDATAHTYAVMAQTEAVLAGLVKRGR